MSFKTNKLRDAISFALAVGATGFMIPAFAQEAQPAAPAPEEATELDTIVVTGTRIQSQTVTASSPITEIDREEFRATGTTRVDDLVNQYPQMASYFDSFANNGATGYATVDLRGLGPERTLTLVNGQRLQPGTAMDRDISQVPAALVKRVDILTGGASAVYGADAVAGVVNFVLDTEFEGFDATVGWSGYQHNNDNGYLRPKLDARGFSYPDGDSGFDGKSKNVDLVWGSSFADGAGHATAWLTWRRNDPLFQGDRDYSSCALNAAGTVCGGSATAPNPNFYIQDQNPDLLLKDGTYAHLNPDGGMASGVGEYYNYAPLNYYQRPEDKLNFGSSLKYEVNEHFRPYVETMYTNRKNSTQVAESGTFFADALPMDCTDPRLGTICADTNLYTGDDVLVYVGKRNVEGGARYFEQKDSSYRVVTGAEGDIDGNWSYNVAALFGRTNGTNVGINDMLADRVVDAMNGCPAGSYDGCIPYNVWEPNGVTPEAATALGGTSTSIFETSITSVNGYVTGDLGFGVPSANGENVAVVAGAEWRREEYSSNYDTHTQEGNFTGAGGPSLPLTGETEVSELFLEAAVPLLSDMGFIDSFNLDLGYRLSDYETSGNENTYKIGFAGVFAENYRIRGGFNRAIRAPNIDELYSTNRIQLWDGADPCAGETPEFTLEQCINTGVTAAQYGNITESPASQYNEYAGGDQDLVPEKADTWTFGITATPIQGLELAVDYYDIQLEDSISEIGAEATLNFCGTTGDAYLCDRVHRNPNTGDLWLGDDIETSGYVYNITDNVGDRHLRGIDLSARYSWDMLGGRMATSFLGTYVLEDEYSPVPTVPEATYDCAGKIGSQGCQTSEWRHIASVRYVRDWYSVNLRWRYIGEMDYVATNGSTPGTTDKLLCDRSLDATCLGDGTLEAYNYFDVSANFQIGQLTDLTVGVNNIADKEPPMVGGSLTDNANSPGGYDQAGRYFFASLHFRF